MSETEHLPARRFKGMAAEDVANAKERSTQKGTLVGQLSPSSWRHISLGHQRSGQPATDTATVPAMGSRTITNPCKQRLQEVGR